MTNLLVVTQYQHGKKNQVAKINIAGLAQTLLVKAVNCRKLRVCINIGQGRIIR